MDDMVARAIETVRETFVECNDDEINNIRLSNAVQDYFYDVIGVLTNPIVECINRHVDCIYDYWNEVE